MDPYKEEFAADTPARTLAEALVGADVFIGLSVAGNVTQDMVRSMARDPIVFAMANPDPEIGYEEVRAAREDAIVATGRSDYPNQVNNVLGFPFLFRGALDVRASDINEAMQLAAVKALAELAREDVPDAVLRAYGLTSLRFGREYLIPKPFDYRVLLRVPPAVARAAMESGVARVPIEDFEVYHRRLETLISRRLELMRGIVDRAKRVAAAGGLPRGRARADPARREDPGGGGDRPSDPPRPPRGDRRAPGRPRPSRGTGDHHSQREQRPVRDLCAATARAAAARRHHPGGCPQADAPAQLLRLA